jgi:3-methylfumaryl-CoA hydratase
MSAAGSEFDISALSPDIVDETIGPLPSRMLAATLGDAIPEFKEGSPIAALSHWLHCFTIVGHDDLDVNGHPRRGRSLPDLPFERRMFAGSDIRIIAPIRVGERIRRTGWVTQIEPKRGRSGDFCLVNLRQEYAAANGPRLIDDQKIVYRAAVGGAPEGEAVLAKSKEQAQWTRAYLPDERMLFRYSALLFSAHRIHFDREYTLGEGYPALVVQGQLAATCLARLAEGRTDREIESFSYRSTAPLFENRTMTAYGRADGDEAILWMTDDRGSLCVKARARFRS